MYRVLGAFVCGLDDQVGDTSSDGIARLLASSCRLLSCTSPELISATSVSAAVSSLRQAELLAATADELAAAHRLIAAVQLANGRLRVRFLRQENLGILSGGP